MLGRLLGFWLLAIVLIPKAAGQGLAVPLGSAAQYGLLAPDSLHGGTARVIVRGRAGSQGPVTGISASDSIWSGAAVATALTDRQLAISYCQSLPTVPFNGKSAQSGTAAYLVSGNLQLVAGAPLRLTGDTLAQLVIRVTGNLVADSGSSVLLQGGLRPERVFWEVGGNVTLKPMTNLPGVVLAGGSIIVEGYQFGSLSLLAGGAIHCRRMDPTIGPGFVAPANVRRHSPASPTWVYGCNEARIYNIDFEDHWDLSGQLGNMPNGWFESELTYWEAVPGGATPDYHHAESPPPPGRSWSDVGVPHNAFGAQPIRTPGEKGYVGFYASAGLPPPPNCCPGSCCSTPRPSGANGPQANTMMPIPGVCDYVRFYGPLPRPNPGQNAGVLGFNGGSWYYGEFYVSLAGKFGSYMDQIGIRIMNEQSDALWFDNHSLTLHKPILVNGQPTYSPTGEALVPQIRFAERTLDDTTGWVRIAGCFQATGTENEMIIGNFQDPDYVDANGVHFPTVHSFNPQAATPDKAYYYFDNLSFTAFPEAGLSLKDTVVLCGQEVRLGTRTDCLLPASSGATYWWTNDLDPTWIGVPSSPATVGIVVNPSQTTTYTLHVRVPMPASTGSWDRTSSVTVRVAPDVCRLSCAQAQVLEGPELTIYDNRLLTGTWSVPDGATLTVDGCRLALASGAQLLMGDGARIVVNNGALLLEGATITAACDQPWDGIYVQGNVSRIETDWSDQQRWSEISHSINGIRMFQYNDTPGSQGHFVLKHTRFFNNYTSFTNELPSAPSSPQGVVPSDCLIQACHFDSDPLYFLGKAAPANGNGDFYSLYHVSIAGDYSSCSIADNYFGRAWVGLRAPNTLFLGTKPFTANRFRNQWLAGVYLAYADTRSTYGPSQVICDGNDFALSTATAFPNQAPQFGDALALISPNDVDDFSNSTRLPYEASYGFFGRYLENLQLTNCKFWQPDDEAYRDYPFTDYRYWQGGAFVALAPEAVIDNNAFSFLHAGLTLWASDRVNVRGNLFHECQNSIRLQPVSYDLVPGTLPEPMQLCINCNTFERNLVGHVAPSVSRSGESYGIYVEPGATVEIKSLAPQPSTLEQVMGNRFADGQFEQTVTQGSYTGTYYGFANAIYNASGAPIEYLAYDDKALVYNWTVLDRFLLPYSMLSANWNGTPAVTSVAVSTPSLSQPGAPPYPVTATANCGVLGYQQGLQAPLRSQGSNQLQTVGVKKIVKEGFILGASIPNPAGSETRVPYQIPVDSGPAQLVVRDLTGRQVLQQTLAPDRGEATLRLTGLPAGVYLYQLVVDGAVRATRRLVVSGF